MSIWLALNPPCIYEMQCLAHLRQHQRMAAGLAQRWPALCRGFAEESSSDTITVEPSPFRGHRVRRCHYSPNCSSCRAFWKCLHLLAVWALLVHTTYLLQIDPPERKVETSKQELMDFHRKMWTMRRVELAADQLYKQARSEITDAHTLTAVCRKLAPLPSASLKHWHCSVARCLPRGSAPKRLKKVSLMIGCSLCRNWPGDFYIWRMVRRPSPVAWRQR